MCIDTAEAEPKRDNFALKFNVLEKIIGVQVAAGSARRQRLMQLLSEAGSMNADQRLNELVDKAA